MTTNRKIWDYLRAQSRPVPTRQVTAALGMNYATVRSSLYRMTKWGGCGVMRRGGSYRSAYYLAKGARFRPVDPGKHPNSRTKPGERGGWVKGVVAMWEKRGVQHRKPEPATELERHWGFLPAMGGSDD